MGGGQASAKVVEAHLAVQAAIRSYQVRGHLAASIDPLGLNNMDREQARKMIIRSVTVDEKVSSDFVVPPSQPISISIYFMLLRNSLQR